MTPNNNTWHLLHITSPEDPPEASRRRVAASRRIEAVLREIGNLVASPEIKKLSQVGKNQNFWGKQSRGLDYLRLLR